MDRRRHLFDTYIDRMMQRQARRDCGIPFDLNPDNNVPERKYPYSREQVNRYLGWLAVRLSERMQTVLPYDRLYSFLAQEPENKQNQPFWTEVRLTNAVFIALSIIAITVLLMPKTLLGIKQAALILSFLLPSSLFLSFVTGCTFLERFPAKKILEDSMITLTIASIVILIGGTFGGLVSSLAVALPIAFSPLALGAVAAVIIAAIIHVVSTLEYSDTNLSYLAVTAGSIILPLLPILFNKSIPSLGIAASIAVAQWIFLVMIWRQESGGVWLAFLLSSFVVGGVALLGGLGITIIAIPNWYETIILLGLFFGILGLLEENPKPIILFLTTLAVLIGGCAANSIGSLVGATAILAIIGLTFLYDSTVAETFIEKTGSIIAYTTDRLLYNLLVKSVLTVKRSIPANCHRLLNYAISALLLKRVGTEYEFIHRLLRDHFAIRELVPTLGENTELKERIQSIERLSFQGESAFDTLAALTQDQDPLIREAAIEGLGRVAIPEVVPLLQTALEDSSIQVRKAVIKNLGKLPDKDSKMILSIALENPALSVQLLSLSISRERNFNDNDFVQQALEQIIANNSFPEILQTLHDSDAGVRSSAAKALGQIGDNRAVPKLIEALGDRSDSVRRSAAAALGQIGDSRAVAKLIEALGDLDDLVRSSAAQALVKNGSTAVPKLIAALGDRKESVHSSAASALGQISDSRAVPRLIEALGDRKWRVRSSAASALGQISDSRAVPRLIEALGDRDYEVRYSAGHALGQIGDNTAVPRLIEALDDREDSVRYSAASALGRIGDSRAVAKLIEALGDRKWRVRSSAASALGQIGDSRAVAKLIEALGDRNDSVRKSAAYALGQIEDSRAVPKLIEALGDREDSVRYSAASALGRIGDSRAVAKLIEALGDRKWRVRHSAASALGQIGDSRAVAKLIEALGDRDYEVRYSAASALGQISDSRAVPRLIEALGDRDKYVREATKEALRKIGTPEALNALE